ncbi:MAG TPA: YgeY family selenium metabolism-linked hydrolase [Terriglobales bacterium]|nr:YgeY family selenium metabolism-linked hydrolase [Terriglobales bacterium]
MTNPPEIILRNREHIAALAQAYEGEMVSFLCDLVAIPAASSHEKPVIERIRREMEIVGFDEIRIDPMGNILGRIGSGGKIIMMDAHTDAVGVGDPKEWAWDPYKGKVENGIIYGRASSDQRGGMASMVYAGKIIKELGLSGDYALYIVGSVQEEDCDGLAWVYILKEDGIAADCVVLTEPTNLKIYRGQRGRMEIEVRVRGRSCHASAPLRGDNPIYKMAPLVREIAALNERLRSDAFLGKGTIAVTDIRSISPSMCAVPGACSIHLDRRLTAGETKQTAVAEVMALPSAQGAEVEILTYEVPSYTGLKYPMEKYFPTWVLEENHPLVQAGVNTYLALHGKAPVVDKWTFSTNGVGSRGVMGVPTIGFGPGEEDVAHSVMECIPIHHLVEAAKFYAAFPLTYVNTVVSG